jgi:amino acid transporter
MTSSSTSTGNGPGGGREGNDDGALDARGSDDVAYLEQMGYRQELSRVLGFFSSFSIQFTGIAVAGGVFLTLGYGLSTIGPAVAIAWAVGGLLQCIVGLSIAEAVSAYPFAGGAYQIINRLASVRLGWQIGFWLIMAHLAALAGEAVGLAPFIVGWFGVDSLTHTQTLLLGGALIAAATVINIVGVRIAAIFNNLGVGAELIAFSTVIVALVITIIAGGHHFHGPSFFGSDGGIVTHGSSSVLPFLYALLVPAFVISGFDVSGTAGEETKRAAITVPKGMMMANVGAYLYGLFGIGLVVLAITNLNGALADPAPMTFILRDALGPFLAKFFEVLAVLALFVNMIVLQLTAARIIWSQARDGQAPAAAALSKLNRNRIPVTATILAAALGVAFTLWSSLLTVLIAMTAVLWAAAYAVLVAVAHVAKRQGRMPARPWHNPAWQAIDAVALVWSVLLCVVLIRQDWHKVGLGFLGVVVIGLVIYHVLIPATRRGRVPGLAAPASPPADPLVEASPQQIA